MKVWLAGGLGWLAGLGWAGLARVRWKLYLLYGQVTARVHSARLLNLCLQWLASTMNHSLTIFTQAAVVIVRH